MSSNRLPGKILENLRGRRTVLQRVVDRVKAVNLLEPLIDNIIVATSNDPSDDVVAYMCTEWEIECFRGSLDDVLGRYYDCASKYGADEIIRVTADCPLIEPLMIWGLIKEPFVFPYKSLDVGAGYIIDGWDCEIFTYKFLEEAYLNANKDQREHVTTYMRKRILDFNSQTLEGQSSMFQATFSRFNFKPLKLSLDTPKELERMKEYDRLL